MTGNIFAVDRRPLASLQVLRGLAAFAVAVYHTHLILAQPKYGGIDMFGAVAGKGWTGVNFFFVLSGFIIPYAHAADIGRPGRAGRYLWRRLTRVYPVYWLVLTAVIVASLGRFHHTEFSWAPANIATAYALVDVIPHPTLPLQVAWTLFYEVAFYIGFLLLIIDRRLGIVLIAGWAGVIAWIGLVNNNGEPGWYLHTWNLYFLCGMGCYALYRRFEGRGGTVPLIAGIALLSVMIAMGLVDDRIAVTQALPRHLLALAVPFTLVLLGAALIERRSGGWRPLWPLAVLGDASYAVYLVHSPVISALATLNLRLGHGHVPAAVLYPVVLSVAVLAGVAVHLVVEKPMLAFIRKHITGRPTP
ncbi:acyltransferase family protein [Novosphingobium sp.]|uniref:acyltransferase family protein n=1 Tax=Novosphingobium sp. TaxID=1874826 RepID=UPI003D0FC066